MNCSSCRVRGQKSKLNYRHAELGAAKVKGKTKTKDVQGGSLFSLSSLFSGKGKRKTNSFFFHFHCNTGTDLKEKQKSAKWVGL